MPIGAVRTPSRAGAVKDGEATPEALRRRDPEGVVLDGAEHDGILAQPSETNSLVGVGVSVGVGVGVGVGVAVSPVGAGGQMGWVIAHPSPIGADM